MIYLLLLLPILTTLITFISLKNTGVVKVGIGFTLFTLIYVLVHSSIMKDNLTDDTEWWGNYAVSVHYYDDWDEEVPCRHPIYCTRSYSCNCDANGNNCSTCTEQYVCGYEHAYDVDYHPEYWSLKWDNGGERDITKSTYDYWVNLWGGKKYKIELNRDYHKNDGDDIACDWDLLPEHSESLITEHTYENRVQATNNVFKADFVDSIDRVQYKLFDYPDSGDKIVLGSVIVDQPTLRLFKYINGYYGSKKQFKLFICCFRNMSEIAAERQHSYWGNLNKNEFLVCIGLDGANQVQWCKSYSWMDKPVLSVKVEQWFRDHKSLNLNAFSKWLPKNIEEYWSRKHFKDFNYIQVEITQSQYTTLFIVCIFICLLQAFITFKIKETL